VELMSDLVDDLQAAEDRIGVLHQTIERLLDAIDHGPMSVTEAEMDARRILSERYCRPGCGEQERFDNPEQEPYVDDYGTTWPPSRCEDDCCGCPCHVRNNQEWDDDSESWEVN
jgi:hypothetical protein